MEGPPEMVEGIVMKVMTSCSLRPARRARNPPMAWMPSWELPARRITASEIFEIFGAPSPCAGAMLASLMTVGHNKFGTKSPRKADENEAELPCPHKLAPAGAKSISNGIAYLLS